MTIPQDTCLSNRIYFGLNLSHLFIFDQDYRRVLEKHLDRSCSTAGENFCHPFDPTERHVCGSGIFDTCLGTGQIITAAREDRTDSVNKKSLFVSTSKTIPVGPIARYFIRVRGKL